MSEVLVSLPVRLTSDLLHAVRNDPLCSFENKDNMNEHIGWLICAYDVLVREFNKREIK